MTTLGITEASVQSLLIEMEYEGQRLATGTAFIVEGSSGPLLITNRHNVTGRNQQSTEPISKTGGLPTHVAILHNQASQRFHWIWRREALFGESGEPLWHEHPSLGGKADFVALPLSALQDVALYPYKTEHTGVDFIVGPGDAVSVIGFPFGLTAGAAFGIWATGFLASEPRVDFNNLPIQLIDCRTRSGQSGAPVIAYRNGGMILTKDRAPGALNGPVLRFIGIYSGRVNEESDLGIVWKASAIAELVASIKSRPPTESSVPPASLNDSKRATTET
jgi:hypothetical protein